MRVLRALDARRALLLALAASAGVRAHAAQQLDRADDNSSVDIDIDINNDTANGKSSSDSSAAGKAHSGPPPSSLQITHLSGPTTCARPTRAGDVIAMHYRGTLWSSGAEFDASFGRGPPLVFTLGAGGVIAGMDAGMLGVCVGETRELVIPAALAYGSGGAGPIPPGAALVFETLLQGIVVPVAGSEIEAEPEPTAADDGAFAIATAPASPPDEAVSGQELGAVEVDAEAVTGEGDAASQPSSSVDNDDQEQAECKLLGSFALFVQAALGALALLTLVWKRWREEPKRPWKIFFFDVSKQVLGSMLTHVINLAMSMLGSGADVQSIAAQAVAQSGAAMQDSAGRTPNPCSFYVLNLGIDTTIGVPVLCVLLRILHALFLFTPLARPPQSIKSGNYGSPAKVTWYLKQLLIYCIGLVGMKLFVLFLFMALPWLPWVGDWALRWTNGNEALEITFSLFIFPLIMNGVQYWIIDNFIMDKKAGEREHGYEQVAEDDDDDDDEADDERRAALGEETYVDIERVPGKDLDDAPAAVIQATGRNTGPSPTPTPGKQA